MSPSTFRPEARPHLTPSVAFVTPSYRLDRERCELLSRSLDACAPSVEHWIVVDRGDLEFFRALENHRTHVVAKEEVLPVWVRRLDTLRIGLRSNVWLQARGWPIRGWLLQQLVKLAIAPQLTADVVVHADSDVVLLRPFSTSSVIDDQGRVRLYSRPEYIDDARPQHVLWHRSAEKMLGIEARGLPLPDFISSLVPWKRANAVALLDHIENQTGTHWLRAVTEAWRVSEHTLHGRFAQDVLGEDAGGFILSPSLCLDYYKRVPLSAGELEALLDRISPDEFAVSLTAKGGMRPAEYVDVLERRWAELDTEVPSGGDAERDVRIGARNGSGQARRAPRAKRRLSGSESRRLLGVAAVRGYAFASAISVLVVLVAFLIFGVD